MAITKTSVLREVHVFPAVDSSAADTTNDGNPVIRVLTEVTLDDPNDDQLPIVNVVEHHIVRYVSDGGAATDVSSEASLVQTIAGAIWS